MRMAKVDTLDTGEISQDRALDPPGEFGCPFLLTIGSSFLGLVAAHA